MTDDAFGAVARWAAAFNAQDVDAILATFSPDALVFGTLSPALTRSGDDLRRYFAAAAAAKLKVSLGAWHAIPIGDAAVLFVGFYEFTRPMDDQITETPARFSMLVLRRDGLWTIAHLHSSHRPPPI